MTSQTVICTNTQRHARGYIVGAEYAPGWTIRKITDIHGATDTCQLDLVETPAQPPKDADTPDAAQQQKEAETTTGARGVLKWPGEDTWPG